jgi:hypothetical protein
MHPTTRPISICTGNGIPNIEPLARGSDCTEAEVDVIVLPLVLQQHWVGQLNRRRTNLSGLPNRTRSINPAEVVLIVVDVE